MAAMICACRQIHPRHKKKKKSPIRDKLLIEMLKRAVCSYSKRVYNNLALLWFVLLNIMDQFSYISRFMNI